MLGPNPQASIASGCGAPATGQDPRSATQPPLIEPQALNWYQPEAGGTKRYQPTLWIVITDGTPVRANEGTLKLWMPVLSALVVSWFVPTPIAPGLLQVNCALAGAADMAHEMTASMVQAVVGTIRLMEGLRIWVQVTWMVSQSRAGWRATLNSMQATPEAIRTTPSRDGA